MTGKAKILVVDDEPDMLWTLSRLLRGQGFEVLTAENGQKALALIFQAGPGLIILDKALPDMDGLERLKEVKERFPLIPVIIITGYGDIPSAVEAIRLGAYDYVTKPFDNLSIVSLVNKALKETCSRKERESLNHLLKDKGSLLEVMGKSQQVLQIDYMVEKVARTDMTVIIQGATGTGKEITARAIHHRSPRRDRPFVALDCGALPQGVIESELFGYEKGAFTGAMKRKEGHFQLAHGGTLFLDEISNLPIDLQNKLLRVVQERKVLPVGGKAPIGIDVRILAATNQDLKELAKQGLFREDLYHRLNEFSIHLPSLQERKEDIPFLVELFLKEAMDELGKEIRGLSDEAWSILLAYDYPGNARELRNIVRRATLLSNDTIEAKQLTVGANAPRIPLGRWTDRCPMEGLSLREIKKEIEKELIKEALDLTKGSKIQAARRLQIEYRTLYNKMKEYKI